MFEYGVWVGNGVFSVNVGGFALEFSNSEISDHT